MQVIYSFNEQQLAQVYGLHQQAWANSGRSLDEIKRCIAGSQVCIAILDSEDNVVAFSRVLTDFVVKAVIYDVIVAKSHQGTGLGQQLMLLIKQHQKLKTVKHFELSCLPEMTTFYEKNGFSTEVDGLNLMRLVNN